ncbi:MAG: lysophospholipid acyltransferase family protein [Gammaproteobacteria bacterium]|nr:lysophospholipid acyltransferase family protein [Gammaproteobacteria bacterium]
MRAALVRLTLRVLSRLPLPVLHRMGDVLGRSLMWFANDLRDTARTNIQRCFPRWDEARQQQLVLQSLQQTARATLETGVLWLRPTDQVLALVKKVSGEELLAQAMARGKGVILAAPHIGAWEIVGVYGSTHWPMTSLYRPPRQAYLNDLIRTGRERAGATLVPTDASGIRALYKALGRGELIGILPDQDPDRDAGVFAPLFGIQANTMTLLSRLASKTGATVLMAYAERLPKGQGYHLHFEATDTALTEGDATQKATALNQAVERCALQHPEQYQWAYKRFKTRPEGEGRFY